jgi:hypothetical protein
MHAPFSMTAASNGDCDYGLVKEAEGRYEKEEGVVAMED